MEWDGYIHQNKYHSDMERISCFEENMGIWGKKGKWAEYEGKNNTGTGTGKIPFESMTN